MSYSALEMPAKQGAYAQVSSPFPETQLRLMPLLLARQTSALEHVNNPPNDVLPTFLCLPVSDKWF